MIQPKNIVCIVTFTKHVLFQSNITVTIIEARNLISSSADGSDPFIKITVANLAPQVTDMKNNANTVVFNQSFTFTNLRLSDVEFEGTEILIQAFSQNPFRQNELIGQQSIGISTLYRSNNHELFKVWLPLINPQFGIQERGLLLVSCYIIGTNDRPPVHDINEYNEEDDEQYNFINIPDDQLTMEQIELKKLAKRGVVTLNRPVLPQEQFQLIIAIAKGEDFPILSYNSCDSFISSRVGSNVLATQVFKNTQKPSFQLKFIFPIHIPVFNDKIVLRVWDKRKLTADNFIASIPEIPNSNDWFNINTLISRGGTMPFKWYHLYGIPLEERTGEFDQLVNGKVKQIEGSAYFGRILISLSISPNNNASVQIQNLTIYKEPQLQRYILRVDTYEIQSLQDCGDYIIVQISFAGKTLRSKYCKKVKTKDNKSLQNQQKKKENIQKVYIYEWKQSHTAIEEELKIDIPQDEDQQPDVIISLKSVQLDKNKITIKDKEVRLAYMRIKAQSNDLKDEYPKWYQMKPIKYSTFFEIHSHALLNVELKTENLAKSKPRHHFKRNIKVFYIFKAYIYGAYDLCPNEFSENILCEMFMQLGIKQIPVVKGKQGKNVIWNVFIQDEIQLDEKLEFSSNIILNFTNLNAKGIMGTNYLVDQSIECEVQVDKFFDGYTEINQNYQFYHIMKNGMCNGRILASFQLFKKDQQIQTDYTNEYIGKILDSNQFNFTQIIFPVIGIRNLPFPLKNPQLILRIAQPDLKFSKIDILQNQQDQPQYAPSNKLYSNPNFCYLLKNHISEPIKIPIDVRFLPQLEIELREKDNLQNQVRYYTAINIIQFIPWITNNVYYSEVMQLFEMGKISHLINLQENKELISQQMCELKQRSNDKDNRNILDENFRKSVDEFINLEHNQNTLNTKIDIQQQDQLPLNQAKEEKQQLIAQQDQQQQSVYNTYNNITNNNDEKVLSLSMISQKVQLQNSEENQLQLSSYDLVQSFKNAQFQRSIKFEKNQEDEQLFQLERNQQINELKKQLIELNTSKQETKQQQLKILRDIETIKKQKVVESQFLEQDEDQVLENFDYGREVQFQPMSQLLQKNIPYLQFPLFQIGKSNGGQGIPTNAVLKAHLKIKKISEEEVNQEKTTRRTNQKNQSQENSIRSIKSVKSYTSSNLRNTTLLNQCLIKYKLEEDDQQYPFDIFKKEFLQFFSQQYPLKLRVYILRCTNLSAQEERIQAYHLLAGLKATCSASAYPMLQVGTGKSEQGRIDIVKMIKDDQSVAKDTLNPEFFKMYELDAFLPEDWNLIVNIMNKGTLMDSLIGQFEIDLEDRVLGQTDLRKKQHMKSIQINIKIKQKFLNISNKMEQEQKEKNMKLKHPCKKTCQGTVEMFIEPFPVDIARIIDPSNIQKPSPLEFEIRLIVWEVFNVPLNQDKKPLSMYVSVALDGNANINGEEIIKQTDVHNGSEDGNGVYNYRMVFPFCIPCLFPRLRIQVFNFSTVGSDENLGETVITLKKALRKLRFEGSYQLSSTKYQLEHPLHQGSRGELQISMSIVSKQLAESQPVGEGQDDPNENPFLEKPKEGRGIANFLKGTSFDLGLWKMIGWKLLIYLGGAFCSIAISLILFYKPGILVK
ncbi:hypothetical protein IMG5_007260 [Ichthyophthirius multifiliis]|uniref:C2 domain-containing protein n=1 Tax=Ichthyophthirius multifiliis TaxID=5932 RepID=G0QJP4_ICHMU|nr:hypothetical protein IMG5_007260 [Ichthyophthirius multifiliis]EGR34566.1 hypothetical protein IMG5_007260 [Ichthyophthirius multifiliis]|eukprot:XP_004039870.1 hypothetical protein IMG5_007260 [Ichthyophthirius multifiliis]